VNILIFTIFINHLNFLEGEMAKKLEKTPVDEIKKNLKTDRLVIGTEKTLKLLKLGKLAKIFIAKNTAEMIETDLKYYSKINNVELSKLDIDNEGLGVLCKKPFSISVIGLKHV